jgi:hypothetical protein
MGASFLGSRARTRLITMDMCGIYLKRRDARKTFKIRLVQREKSSIYDAHWFFGVSPSALPSPRGAKRRILRLDGPYQAFIRLFFVIWNKIASCTDPIDARWATQSTYSDASEAPLGPFGWADGSASIKTSTGPAAASMVHIPGVGLGETTGRLASQFGLF